MTGNAVAATIGQAAADVDGDLIALRRDLHRWPESAADERAIEPIVLDCEIMLTPSEDQPPVDAVQN
ncbi:hypothetical protein [Saccharothrix deserti]|uniref:hypothetical protein n=1 Tax=Saccharothrix deserti TaxID=2593674 RepID=UPI00131E4B7D|nr:hypothetical protein [Saccharothrix deserti]